MSLVNIGRDKVVFPTMGDGKAQVRMINEE